MAGTVHQLTITLRSVKPPVWRRIAVRSDTALGEAAVIMERAMGWKSYHLHSFDADGTTYATPDPDWDNDDEDEDRFRVADVLPNVGSKLRWYYDFGDGWEHDVAVEKIGSAEAGVRYPFCIAGARACPPEDCGGPSGYERLRDALADPSHPEHGQLRDWAPPNFDPAHFDVKEASKAMRFRRRDTIRQYLSDPVSIGPSVIGLHHIQLAMPEGGEVKAVEFYEGILGIPELPKPSHLAGRGGCWFEAGSVRLHLGVEADFQPARKAHPALLVDDLSSMSTRLGNAGVEVVDDEPLPGFLRFYAYDPFGNRLEFLQSLDDGSS